MAALAAREARGALEGLAAGDGGETQLGLVVLLTLLGCPRGPSFEKPATLAEARTMAASGKAEAEAALAKPDAAAAELGALKAEHAQKEAEALTAGVASPDSAAS